MIYTVHMREDARPVAGDKAGESLFDSMLAVPESVAKWALILPPFWLAYNRLWWPLTVYLAILISSFALLATPLAAASLFLGGLPGLYLLLEGNQLRRLDLENRGYRMVDICDAADERIAVEKALAKWDGLNWPKASQPAASLRGLPRPETVASFGIFPEQQS